MIDRIAALWEALNKKGIYNQQDLDKEMKKLPALDLSLMTGNLKEENKRNASGNKKRACYKKPSPCYEVTFVKR